MMSLKDVITNIIKVRFCHNQFEKPQFGQITQLQVTKIED